MTQATTAPFSFATADEINQLFSTRDGETKIGQRVQVIDQDVKFDVALATAKANGVKFAIIGISEDIGPRANLGRGGAVDALESALSYFLNQQSNRFLDGSQCLVLGNINTDDLQLDNGSDAEQLRDNVALLDQRVIAALTPVFEAGIEPIVIGGGHNNAYGLLMAAKASFNRKIAAVNLDPHSDFRPREGRHSGNGFSYAAAGGALGYYHILGLHELKNSEQTLCQLDDFGGHYHSFQAIWSRQEISLTQALDEIIIKLNDSQLPVAVELDLDAISNMPSSAQSAVGVPLNDALFYVNTVASTTPCAYLHLAEAAPRCHVSGIEAGKAQIGQSLSELIYSYVQARK